MRRLVLVSFLLCGCLGEAEAPAIDDTDIGVKGSNLTAAQRRARAGQIRDAAWANGMSEGYLLAGIADSETSMSHCWSELTWACMGPHSADCGGPVVAGAGDGACSLRQGGLGMFQFDAGTYDQTLAREGTRVLSIAGNVAAAVDFVVAMVIRSVYISGVDNRAQAIDWMNGVRVGNERWDPWIRTVTHYYNGCTPSASCFSSRYARYRDHTANVRTEMGTDFWVIGHDFGAAYSAQSFPLARDPFNLYPGQEAAGFIEMRNTGNATWRPGQTNLGTTQPRDAASAFAGPDWLSPSRPATIDRVVAPGEVGRFNFTVRAPSAPGDYPQFFNLVQEGVTWFQEQGGPADNQLQVRVTVVPEPTCPGVSGDWTCDGSDRIRCDAGNVVRETCEYGCMAGMCAGPPVDLDGDGAFSSTDCNDSDPTVYPGASELCGDAVDQDCNGSDLSCTPDIEDDAGMGEPEGDAGVGGTPHSLSGSCSASPGRTGGWMWLLAIGLAWMVRRRR